MFNRSMPEMIYVAHQLVEELLPTEVTVYDVESALEKYCVEWDAADRTAVLRLAVEFADITGNSLFMAQEVTHAETMAEMEHHLFVAYDLGGYLDLPVVYGWGDEDREQSTLLRKKYPLNPDRLVYWHVADFPQGYLRHDRPRD